MIQEINWIFYPENKPEPNKNIIKIWSGFGSNKISYKIDRTDFKGNFDNVAGSNKVIAFAYIDDIYELQQRADELNQLNFNK